MNMHLVLVIIMNEYALSIGNHKHCPLIVARITDLPDDNDLSCKVRTLSSHWVGKDTKYIF